MSTCSKASSRAATARQPSSSTASASAVHAGGFHAGGFGGFHGGYTRVGYHPYVARGADQHEERLEARVSVRAVASTP
jgi:hypothetical protein